jgi:Spy/CpxP family protein refolding chaperone
MKTTKDYLLLTASIAIGIIIGMSVMLLIGNSVRKNIMNERMEMGGNFGSGYGPSMHFAGGDCAGMKSFNKPGMRKGKMGMNRMQGHKGQMGMHGNMRGNMQNGNQGMTRMLSQLDLTADQQKQIDEIMEKKQERFQQMQDLRESRWEASTKEIQDILTDEQKAEYDKIMKRNGKSNHAPGYYVALKRLNLTDDQKKKVEALMERNKEMREGMWKSRQQEMETTIEEIKSVLTEEQIEKLENMPMYDRLSKK